MGNADSEVHDLVMPVPQPECTPEQILAGKYVDPLDRIKLYSDEQFEVFIHEWAFFYLQQRSSEYVRVVRFGGAGDKGRDVVGYVDEKSSPRVLDVYQCKHYEHGLYPSDIWPELAKLCFHVFSETIERPRHYYIVAPQDVGSELGRLLETPSDLKSRLIVEWDNVDKATAICKTIERGKSIVLNKDLRSFVESFDFSIVKHKPILEIVSEHRQTIRHAPRFGGGLQRPLPEDITPPQEVASLETVYVGQLIAAYRDKERDNSIDLEAISRDTVLSKYDKHLRRSRERFYCAETLLEFARDTLPEQYSFSDVQDQVCDGVIDTVEREFPSGFERANATTDAAASVQIRMHPLQSYVKGKSLRGICHQLVNGSRISWVDGHNGS